MKIFLSYKFSGEDVGKLKKTLESIAQVLEYLGHQTFIYYRDIQKWHASSLSPGQIISSAFEELNTCDAILAYVNSSEKSEGLLLEVGYAKALGKQIILVVHKNARAILLREVADTLIEFERT